MNKQKAALNPFSFVVPHVRLLPIHSRSQTLAQEWIWERSAIERTSPKAPVEADAKRRAMCWERARGRTVRRVRMGGMMAVKITRVRIDGWMMTESDRAKRVLIRGLSHWTIG
jgi:hypothetical protein